MAVRWNFPNNGGGQIRGISDAGIETFTGNEIQSLAREICQNSLDAADPESSSCVHVEFERYKIKTSEIPGYIDYKYKIENAFSYWSTRKSAKTILYLKEVKKYISEPCAYVLRISDYNTIGLLDPFGDSDEGWNALIKIDGGATKNGDKAGAFGIGKNAPFCNSNYRLVFYRTLNADGEIAAQGVSRFISFPEDLNNTRDTMTTGIGYYGEPCGNLPVCKIEELDNLNIRNKVGTDVFIYGFNAGFGWEGSVICEILDNFLIAIFRNQLSVTVSSNKIDSNLLARYMEKYRTNIKQSYSYYKVLSSPETKIFTQDFHGLGTLKLHILVNPQEKLNRKILVTRTSGMKLFAIGNISRLISFSGILEMQGKDLNEYFREMETPAHDRWVPGRYTKNPEQAKAYHDELKQWIRDMVLNLGEYSIEEEIEVEGLAGVLQKESSVSSQKGDDRKESLSNTVDNIFIQARNTSQTNHKGVFFGTDEKGKSQKKDVDGTISKSGFPATRHLNGNRKRAKKELHKGFPKSGGKDTIHQRYGGDNNQPLENVRIVKVGIGVYRVSFIVPKDIKSGHIEIVTVGENGKSNKLNIKGANGIVGCSNVERNISGIIFTDMKCNEKVSVEFSLFDSHDYAMEVNVYEHN